MTRSEYRNNLKLSLRSMETRITNLEARIGKADIRGKRAVLGVLDEVKSKRDAVRTRLRRAGSATESAWKEIEQGLDGAWTELERSYKRARIRFASASHSH